MMHILQGSARRHFRALRERERELSAAYALDDARGMIDAGLSYLIEQLGQKEAEPQIMDLLDRTGAFEEPDLLATARTPEAWAERFTKAGKPLAAAMIRDGARVCGYYYWFPPDEMILSPSQLDAVFLADREHKSAPHMFGTPRQQEAYRRALARLAKPKEGRLAQMWKKPKRKK